MKDSDNASPAVRTKKPRLSHSNPVQTPHSSKRKRVSKPRLVFIVVYILTSSYFSMYLCILSCIGDYAS